MSSQNSNYKETWNTLAATEESAFAHVAGYSDEARLEGIHRHHARLAPPDGWHPVHRYLPRDRLWRGARGRELAPLVARWIGCDVSENMLQHAGHRLAGLQNVALVPISGYDLKPIPDASVDAVYCTVCSCTCRSGTATPTYARRSCAQAGGRFFCDNANLASEDGWKMFLASAAFPADRRPQHLSRCSTCRKSTATCAGRDSRK